MSHLAWNRSVSSACNKCAVAVAVRVVIAAAAMHTPDLHTFKPSRPCCARCVHPEQVVALALSSGRVTEGTNVQPGWVQYI